MLIARTDANGQVTAYYMPNAGGGPTQITIAPTGAAPGSSITAGGKPLDPAGDEDEDGKGIGQEIAEVPVAVERRVVVRGCAVSSFSDTDRIPEVAAASTEARVEVHIEQIVEG